MSYHTNLVAFRIPKPGEGIEDCQDSFMVDPDRQCFALSDGVSRSFLPGLWARMLVDYFKSSSIFETKFENNQIREWFEPLLELWDYNVKEHFKKPFEQLPFYVRNNLQKPAFATLAVLELRSRGESGEVLDWKAIAVGDTCVFHFRDGQLIKVIPSINSTEFSNYPVVIPSKKNELEQRLATYEVPTYSGEALRNDRFFLATDALAKWILVQHEEQNYEAIQELLTIDDHIKFQRWAIHHRNKKGSLQLEGDDTSFISITIESQDKDQILQPDGWPTLEESLEAEIAAQPPVVAETVPPSTPVEAPLNEPSEPVVVAPQPPVVEETAPPSTPVEAPLNEPSEPVVVAPQPPVVAETVPPAPVEVKDQYEENLVIAPKVTVKGDVSLQGTTEQVPPTDSPTQMNPHTDPPVTESLLMRFWSWLTSLFRKNRDKKSRIQSVL